MTKGPTFLGYIGAVAGGSLSVKLAPGVASGIAIIGGTSYRVGQVGSFVRIPQGYHDLYGIIADVGANSTPQTLSEAGDRGERWMTVQLVGEVVGSSFERGIAQQPSINDEVHLVVEADLARIYGTPDAGQVAIGRLANAEGIPVRIDLDKLVTRHCAVLGSTGSGKSTTVSSLIRSIVSGAAGDDEDAFPNSRIILLDIHGEYGRALQSVATIFRVGPTGSEQALNIPYWALDPAELLTFLMGKVEDKAFAQVLDRIFQEKVKRVTADPIPGISLDSMTIESPVPFSLKQLWFDLYDPEIKTWDDKDRTVPAKIAEGDAETLKPRQYKPHSTNNTAPYQNQMGVLGIRRQLEHMRSRLLDRQYDFLLHPGLWEADLAGKAQRDLPDLLKSWLGHDKPVTVLDLSGVPSTVLVRLIGAILKVIFDGLFWAREKSEGGVRRPLLVVMEEAHRYLSRETDSPAREMVQRIVKEGRKFGIGAMVVSQRPTEVDETILSQCGTFIALRLSNAGDRAKVQAALPDSLAGIVDSLPVLRTGEAIITGEAARLPIRCRITLPAEENRPASEDPEVAKHWRNKRLDESYARVASSWRAQNPKWAECKIDRKALAAEEIAAMERELVSSSTIVSIGYEGETLEVEFKNGTVYQYYNVPEVIHSQLMESNSKGAYLNENIRNAFAYSRV